MQKLAHPPDKARFGASMRAYAASKLCNLLTARALVALDEVKARRVEVIAYNPGFTLGTGLGRADSHREATSLPARPSPVKRAILGLVSRFKSALHPGTPERAGEVLAQLVLGTVRLPPGRVYASLVKGELTFPDPAALACSDEARDRLWRESAAMVGDPVEQF